MLLVVVLVLEFLGLALLFQRVTGASLAVAPAASAAIVIVVLFFADYLGGLYWASITLHTIGIASMLFCAVAVLRCNWHVGLRSIAASSGRFAGLLLLATAAAVSLYYLNRDGAYKDWDEFSHWGTIIRAIWEKGSFHFDPNPLYFQDYPPGTALFAFHLLTLLGYTEGHAYFAYAFFVALFALPIIAPAFRVGYAAGAVATAIVFLLFFALGFGWSTVLIDHVLGVVFAGTVAMAIQSPGERGNDFAVPPSLAALALVKHAGISLALLAAVICVIWRLVPIMRASWPIIDIASTQDSGRRLLIWGLACFSFPLAMAFAWNAHVEVTGATTSIGSRSVVSLMVAARGCCISERETHVARNFFATLFSAPPRQKSEPVSVLGAAKEAVADVDTKRFFLSKRPSSPLKIWLVLFLVGLLLILIQRDPKLRWQTAVCSTLLLVGAIGYSGSLLLYYLYVFSDYEAAILISFTRYQNVYLLAWGLVVTTLWGLSTGRLGNGGMGRTLVWLLALAGLWNLGAFLPQAREFAKAGAPTMTEERRSIRDWTAQVVPLVPRNASVFIVWQASNGREFWQAKYELLPRVTNKDCYSLGEPQYDGDVWTCKWNTAAKLGDELANFDYLAIGRGYQYVANYYGKLFSGGPRDADRALFRIERIDGSIRLSKDLLSNDNTAGVRSY